MKKFDIYTNRLGNCIAVKVSSGEFSAGAFFFTWIWAFINKLYKQAIICLLYITVIQVIIYIVTYDNIHNSIYDNAGKMIPIGFFNLIASIFFGSAGLFLKSFEFEGSGAHKTLVCYGCIRLWNSTEWTDWEEISREKAPYMTKSELENIITYSDSVIFSEFEGQKIIFEMTPNNEGKYWWWTKQGNIQFFQNIYLVKGF